MRKRMFFSVSTRGDKDVQRATWLSRVEAFLQRSLLGALLLFICVPASLLGAWASQQVSSAPIAVTVDDNSSAPALREKIEAFLSEQVRRIDPEWLAAHPSSAQILLRVSYRANDTPRGILLLLDVKLYDKRTNRFLLGLDVLSDFRGDADAAFADIQQTTILKHFVELVQSWTIKDLTPLSKLLLDRAAELPESMVKGILEASRTLKGAGGVPLLSAILKNNPEPYWAILALGDANDRSAGEALMSFAADASKKLRHVAIDQLGTAKFVPAASLLMSFLADKDASVRAQAVSALASMKHAEALEPILKLTSDPSEDVRLAVARAAENLGRAETLKNHRAALRTRFDIEKESRLKLAFGPALYLAGDKDVRGYIFSVLRGKSEGDRDDALTALAFLFDQGERDQTVVDEFATALKSSNKWARSAGARGLERVFQTKSVSDTKLMTATLITALLLEEDDYVQRAMMDALRSSGSPDGVKPILKIMTQSKNIWVTARAAEALGALGDPSVADELRSIFKQTERSVCLEAIQEAIDKIDGRQKTKPSKKAPF